VSPTVLEESFGAYDAYFRGFERVRGASRGACLLAQRRRHSDRPGASIARADEPLTFLNRIGAKTVSVIFTVEAIPKTLTFRLDDVHEAFYSHADDWLPIRDGRRWTAHAHLKIRSRLSRSADCPGEGMKLPREVA
jgi:hypothetical protein